MILTFSSSSCLWFLVISSFCTLCLCNQNQDDVLCKVNERLALIQFKNKLINQANRLSSWTGNDCCSWSGVVCDNFTGHVHEIRLRGPDDTDNELEEASKQMLGGNISSSLIKLVQLRYLDLSCNDFGFGPVPAFIGSLENLTYLNMSKSQFGGEVPQKLGNLSRLRVLALQDDKVFSNLHSNNLSWLRNLKQLQHLDMVGVNLAEASDWLQVISTLSSLQELHFSSCSLTQIPSDPTTFSFTSLIVLDLSNNIFDSLLPRWIFSLQNLELLDLSANHFNGPMPSNFSKLDIVFLDLSYNNISGSLDQYLCSEIQEPRLLKVLNLGNNNMSGIIPDCWINWESLIILNLEKNRFSGIIPPSLGNISSLASLKMRNNRLFGSLPVSLLNSKSLIILELAENRLTGQIPASIGRERTSLMFLSLRSNKLDGNIPVEICHLSSIQILDLAHNDLSGNLPTCFKNFSVISGRETPIRPIVRNDGLLQIQGLGSVTLVIKGRVFEYSTILYLVTQLDLSENLFSGSIPSELVELPGLRYLNLSQNNLTGRIPNTFREMRQLESLDLSLNHLDGMIPSSLSSLTSLNDLNVSYNNLTGRIPTGPQLQLFTDSSFVGNALCGAPLAACKPNNDDTEGTNDQDDESDAIDWILVIFTLVGLAVGFWIIIVPLLVSIRWRNAYYHFLDDMRIKLQDFILLIFPCYKPIKKMSRSLKLAPQVNKFSNLIRSNPLMIKN